MIHLDSYEWAGQTYIRAWDTEECYSSEDLLALLGPPKPSQEPLRITEVPEEKSFWAGFWPRVWR